MRIRKVILLTGGVETLTFFSQEIGRTLAKEGYQIFYYELKKGGAVLGRLKKFIKPRETMLLTFNFMGLSKEDEFYNLIHGYLWEQYQVDIYNILVEHPLYYHKQFGTPILGYRHISIDRNHENYIRRYYPNVKICGFLPLAGTELDVAHGLPEGKRDIPVLMTGNYREPLSYEPYIQRIDKEYAEFYYGIARDMIENPKHPIEETVRMFCEKEMDEISDENFRDILANMGFIDLFVRNTVRGEVVKLLVDSGITVHAVGSGWDLLKCNCPENLILHPMADSKLCLEYIKRARISLNVMPGFKDGAHDRIFSGILNGAVSVSDSSTYLNEILPPGCGICYYDLQNLQKLPSMIERLWKKPQNMKLILKKGYQEVKKNHIWENRAMQIINWIKAV